MKGSTEHDNPTLHNISEELIFDVKKMASPFEPNSKTANDVKTAKIIHELDFGCGAISFDGSNITNMSDEDRDREFISWGSRLGPLQIRGKVPTPIWHVELKQGSDRFRSYSELSDQAPFHTDASYYPMPMKYLVFLAIRAARVGGENQVFCLGRRLENFASSPRGEKAIDILQSENFPFSMSPAFHNGPARSEIPIEYGPILSDNSNVRFQINALREGFRRRPDLASKDKISAVELFNEFVQYHLNGRGVRLVSGQVMIVNN